MTISINLVVQPVTNMRSLPKCTRSIDRVFQPAAKTRSPPMNPSIGFEGTELISSVFQPGPASREILIKQIVAQLHVSVISIEIVFQSRLETVEKARSHP